MTVKGTSDRYGVLAAALHWTSAIAILALLPLGFLAAGADDPAHTAALMRWHMPLGLLVLGLTLVRAIWRLFDLRPDPSAGQPGWQVRIAHATHAALYVLIFVLCGSGIGLAILSNAGPAIFAGDGAKLPDFSAFPPFWAHLSAACLLLALLALHVGAAMHHQFVKRDRLLGRMHIGPVLERQ